MWQYLTYLCSSEIWPSSSWLMTVVTCFASIFFDTWRATLASPSWQAFCNSVTAVHNNESRNGRCMENLLLAKNHPRTPGLATVDYNSSLSLAHPSKSPLNISQWNRSLDVCMVQTRSCDHNVFSAKREGLLQERTGHYIGIFPPIVYPSSNWGGYLHCSHGWHSSNS